MKEAGKSDWPLERLLHEVMAAAPATTRAAAWPVACLVEDALNDATQAGFFGVTPANARQVIVERMADLRACARDLGRGELVLTDQRIRVALQTTQLWRFYLPLGHWVAEEWRAGRAERPRLVAGVCGIGASGKTMFCEILRTLLQQRLAPDGVSANVVALDGYHLPNAYLDAHFGRDPSGTRVSLRMLKGAPHTYDAARARADLLRLRECESPLRFPAYSRVLHDPVEGAVSVTPKDRIVLVEGNFLLLDDPAWRDLRSVLDLSLFLHVPRDAAKRVMVSRLARGRWTSEQAAERYDWLDARNADLILASMKNADVVVERDEDFRITRIRWN